MWAAFTGLLLMEEHVEKKRIASQLGIGNCLHSQTKAFCNSRRYMVGKRKELKGMEWSILKL